MANTLNVARLFPRHCYNDLTMNIRQKFQGVATVELALIMPILIVSLTLGIEVGRAVQARASLVNGLHNSVLFGEHAVHREKTLKRDLITKAIIIDDVIVNGRPKVFDDMDKILVTYVNPHKLLNPKSDYFCRCNPNPITSPNLTPYTCADPIIKACPDSATEAYLTHTATIEFHHSLKDAFGGPVPIGPHKAERRIL